MGKLLSYTAAAMLLVAFSGGCSMCQVCELETYSAYGGRWQRTDRDHGRVASAFAPAGAQVAYTGSPDSVGADFLPASPTDEAEDQPETDRESAPEPEANDSILESEEDREQREQRLRDLELEDIRYRK